MPANKPYPGENPIAAAKRIARGQLDRKRSHSKKRKGSGGLMTNVMPTIKNMGY